MKTAIFIYLMLLLTEMAVAQKPDIIPIKHPSLQKADTIPQKKKNTLWYINAPNLSYGNFYLLPGLGFVMLNEKYGGASIELKKGAMIAGNIPRDFEPGSFFNTGDGRPSESTTIVMLSYVRPLRFKSPKITPTFQAGLSYSEREYPDNFIYLPPAGGWFGSDNYNYEMKTSKAIGFYFKPSVQYLVIKNIAVSLAPWTVLQQRNSYYGIELGFQFGKLR